VPPYPDRRGSDREDSGERRRAEDAVERITEWMETHDDWARDWSARIDERMTSVERRADLLDGRAGNDQGLIGQLGEMRGELTGLRSDVQDVKAKTGAVDGQKPETRAEKYAAIIIPVLVAVLPVVGTIIAAWLALKGQLSDAPGK
jgi:hypothetical protein